LGFAKLAKLRVRNTSMLSYAGLQDFVFRRYLPGHGIFQFDVSFS
jgi:hypothetical protein